MPRMIAMGNTPWLLLLYVFMRDVRPGGDADLNHADLIGYS